VEDIKNDLRNKTWLSGAEQWYLKMCNAWDSLPIGIRQELQQKGRVVVLQSLPQLKVVLGATECGICMEPLKTVQEKAVTKCGHVFCFGCLQGWRASNQANAQKCPVCRTDL